MKNKLLKEKHNIFLGYFRTGIRYIVMFCNFLLSMTRQLLSNLPVFSFFDGKFGHIFVQNWLFLENLCWLIFIWNSVWKLCGIPLYITSSFEAKLKNDRTCWFLFQANSLIDLVLFIKDVPKSTATS